VATDTKIEWTDAMERLIATAHDLLRELATSPCPGGGYTGQPEDEEPTTEGESCR
jgi:hypothetical protein